MRTNKKLSKEAETIEILLQDYYSDEWTVEEKHGIIMCCFLGKCDFSLYKEGDDWHVTGADIELDMMKDIGYLLEQIRNNPYDKYIFAKFDKEREFER